MGRSRRHAREFGELKPGAPAEASSMLEPARALSAAIGAPRLTRARIWRGLSQARFALGGRRHMPEGPEEHLAIALATFEELGAKVEVARGRHLVRKSG